MINSYPGTLSGYVETQKSHIEKIGWAWCIFLLLVLPSNIYAAWQRVDFGGHAAGPVYLLVRIPLQLL